MKTLLLILGVIVAIPAMTQTRDLITGTNIKLTKTTDVVVTPGLTAKLSYPADSAKILNFVIPKGEAWTITYTAAKVGTTPVPPTNPATVTVQAEGFTASMSARVAASGLFLVPTATGVAGYSQILLGTKTSMTIRYSIATVPAATVTIKIGTVTTTVSLDPTSTTGSWGTYVDKTFTIPATSGTQDVVMTFSRGLNVDWFRFQ